MLNVENRILWIKSKRRSFNTVSSTSLVANQLWARCRRQYEINPRNCFNIIPNIWSFFLMKLCYVSVFFLKFHLETFSKLFWPFTFSLQPGADRSSIHEKLTSWLRKQDFINTNTSVWEFSLPLPFLFMSKLVFLPELPGLSRQNGLPWGGRKTATVLTDK